MSKLVGYLTNTNNGREGQPGILYDYILASNGLWIEADNRLMRARVPIAEAEVRGLAPLEPKGELHYGKVPAYLFDLALNEMLKDPGQEKYIAITYDHEYHIQIPEQKTSAGSVEYSNPDNVVLDLHSHGQMNAFFSGQDNKDEQGFKIYGVVGGLRRKESVGFRVGVYGYFFDVLWDDVFDGIRPYNIFDIHDAEDVVNEEITNQLLEEGEFKSVYDRLFNDIF